MSGRTAAGLKLRKEQRKKNTKKKGRNVTTMRDMNSGKRLTKNIKKEGEIKEDIGGEMQGQKEDDRSELTKEGKNGGIDI